MSKNSYFAKMDKYFNKQKKYMEGKIDNTIQYNYRFSKDKADAHIIEIIDNDKVIKAKYEMIGMYNMLNSVWYWAWNVQFLDKKLASKSNSIREVAKDIKSNYKKYDPVEADALYYLSKHGNFFVFYENIMCMIKLMLFVTKGLWYIPICFGKDNTLCEYKNDNPANIKRIEYLMITQILQK